MDFNHEVIYANHIMVSGMVGSDASDPVFLEVMARIRKEIDSSIPKMLHDNIVLRRMYGGTSGVGNQRTKFMWIYLPGDNVEGLW